MFLEKFFTSLCFLNLFKLWICWEPCKYRLGKFNCLWTLPSHLYLFSQIDAFKGALQELLVLIKKWVFQDYLIPPLISTCKAHKLRENTRHTMLHTRLYISGQIQKICFLQSNIAICLCLYGTSVLQNLFHCLYFWSFFCVRDRHRGLQWVLMVFSARFLVPSGGFLLWILRKRSTPTFVRNTAIERVIKFFLCVQTWL